MRRLAALQDALGVANDAIIAERVAGFLAGWAAHAAEREIRALPELWGRFEAVGRFWPKR